ncbi:MAG: hypothetical protein CVU87_05530 [Firmicutes bacterium HGW-Firmicutes-12]|jgi:hypothetical protein|nr:MAG: hypothetical protein CVU87_05530 [Firmicutes bacterium HGW-Firmicutes-12]
MQIYGSSQNIETFTKYGLKMLEDARMDYMKGLKQVEIFLGEVFRCEVDKGSVYQIFDTEIDKYRRLFGEEIIKVRIKSYLGRELGRIVQKIYLPKDSLLWLEMEKILGYKFDYTIYHSRINGNQYCPAEENAADIFDHAVNGSKRITLTQIREDLTCSKEVILSKNDNRLKRTKIAFDPHRWREWFYGLWGQKYEWGSFHIDDTKAIANGLLYFFETTPRVIDKVTFVPAKDFLEGHGFAISSNQKGKLEYWR